MFFIVGGETRIGLFYIRWILILWFSLENIPHIIMKMIRKKIFNFFWFEIDKSEKTHLVGWRRLSKPKSMGCWDIKNLHWFGSALCILRAFGEGFSIKNYGVIP